MFKIKYIMYYTDLQSFRKYCEYGSSLRVIEKDTIIDIIVNN